MTVLGYPHRTLRGVACQLRNVGLVADLHEYFSMLGFQHLPKIIDSIRKVTFGIAIGSRTSHGLCPENHDPHGALLPGLLGRRHVTKTNRPSWISPAEPDAIRN
jgi:hypothetical protein